MDQPHLAVYREQYKETVAGVAWGCPTTHRAIRSLAPILCPQHMLLLQEDSEELSCFLCSFLHKTVGVHGDNVFQGGTDAWGNSSLCSGQITSSCKWLWWHQGLYQPNIHWVQLSVSLGVTGLSQQWDSSCTLDPLRVSSNALVSDLQPYQLSLMEPWCSVSFFLPSMEFQRTILLQYI